MTDNPILNRSTAPFGAPRFDLIKHEHYLPAFREAISLAKADIDAITSCPGAPSFANTIEALEYSGRLLSRVEGIFFNLYEALTDEELQKIAEDVTPMLNEYHMYVLLNARLFARIKAVCDSHPQLSPDAAKLLDDTYKSFVRGGANLSDEDKAEYTKLSEQLSLLELKFGNNVLAATNAFTLYLTDRNDLEGLPDYLVDYAAEEASGRGLEGWVFTLHFPSYNPFLTYSSRRDLRERMWRAYAGRAIGGDNDNTRVVRDIAGLRIKIAHILGYDSYADYALEDRMARKVKTVNDFLDRLMAPSLPVARKELADILEFAQNEGFEGERLEPWDFKYWAQKYKESHYDLDEKLLKPYFRLEDCIGAVFGLANKLYGITFNEVDDVPVYHPDVRVYDVKDERGEHLSLFYADFFPRPSKRGGAWMTEFRGQYMENGVDFRPFVSIVTNFSKPTADTPSLLTHDEFTTLLHEFGHSLHGMLSRGRYPSLSGTNVARDFVELPSQIMENWAFETEYLNTFARHYKTGAPIPADYIKKISASRNYLAGYQQVRQLQFGIIDMAWHTLHELPSEGTVEFEHKVLAPYSTLPSIDGAAQCPSFSHIFNGGYSAGYYSYKWAEVLDADGFEAFKEAGIFSKEVASRFRREILEKGSSEDEALLYRRFRGHDPEPEALLRKLEIL